MSGVDVAGRLIRKGALDSVSQFVEDRGGRVPPEVRAVAEDIAKQGGTPLVVAAAEDGKGASGAARVLGVVHLKDVVKGGIRERFRELRQMGIKTVMITGDNPMTAASIAAEAGVDQSNAAQEAASFTLQTAQKKVEVDKAKLDTAQFNLDQCTVYAPADGFVTNWQVREGAMAVPLPLSPMGTRTGAPHFGLRSLNGATGTLPPARTARAALQ